MGFFTLLLLGAIFVGSNAQDTIRQDQDFRQLLQEPIRQLQEPLQDNFRRLSSQYDRMFEKQNVANGLYLPPQSPPQYQSQYLNQKSQQQVSLPKSLAESSTSTDKLRQSLAAQEQPLYAQELVKKQELATKSSPRGVTTVCVQVHSSDHSNPVVCGPEITPAPNQITNYKSPPQEETVPQDKPKPSYAPLPARPQFMRVPVVYQSYIPARQMPQQPLSLRCEPDSSDIYRFTNNYRLANPVPLPTEYGLSLGLTGERTVLPGSTDQYQWGAPLSRSSAVDRSNLMQGTDLRRQPLEQSVSQLRNSEMNLYGESLMKSIDDIMRASENAASPSSYMSPVPGYDRASDLSAVKRLEESRDKLRKLTLEQYWKN
ncbi:hypothetical protein LSTR_LSTR014219 [Laodelphax striatellus]|uniref:Uncharacterized protein n=1 Tax=Laodelphax striatellus TaxID=195883 RepID=A0A482X2B6_LAOST|nr:hypothetical protein LSTR_LSTR014219 [Laodelphax striatellus]